MTTTHRFEGRSIEDALAAAAEALGPSLQVTDARRIREGGVMGFFSKERFEVVAEEAAGDGVPHGLDLTDGSDAPTDDGRAGADATAGLLDDTLRALVEDVESQEGGGTPPVSVTTFADALAAASAQPAGPASTAPVTPVTTAVASADLDMASVTADLVDPAVPERDEIQDLIDRAGIAIAAIRAGIGPSPDADPEIITPAPPAPAVSTPVAPVAAASAAGAGEPQWSRLALAQLGLPQGVLSRLPVLDPDSDLEWTAALGRAIAAEVPPPATLGPENRLTVSGHGPASAIDLIRAAAAGFAPSTIVISGTTKPATSTELALAIRDMLPRG